MTKLSSVRSLGKKRVAVRVRRIGGSNKYEVVPGSITMLSGEVKVGERDGAPNCGRERGGHAANWEIPVDR